MGSNNYYYFVHVFVNLEIQPCKTIQADNKISFKKLKLRVTSCLENSFNGQMED